MCNKKYTESEPRPISVFKTEQLVDRVGRNTDIGVWSVLRFFFADYPTKITAGQDVEAKYNLQDRDFYVFHYGSCIAFLSIPFLF